MKEKAICKFMLAGVAIIGGYELLHFKFHKKLLDINHQYELEEESLRFKHTAKIISMMNPSKPKTNQSALQSAGR